MDLRELGEHYRITRNELWDLGARIESELLASSDLSDAEAAELVGWTEATVAKIRNPTSVEETRQAQRKAREARQKEILSRLSPYGTEYHEALRMVCEITGWTVPSAKKLFGELETLGKINVTRKGQRISSVSLVENGSQLGL